MRTEQTAFNIIWLDDQISDLYQLYKKELRDAGIKVLGKGAHDVEEFEHQMHEYKYAVDAVVTDANLNLKVKDNFDGLLDVSYLIKEYNKYRPIPFFVFSGRDTLYSTVNPKALVQFDGIFEKQKGIAPLIEKIKEVVLKVNSKEFRVRNKYAAELKAASVIPENEKELLGALLYEYSENWEKTENYFNSIRKITERILVRCQRLQIVPQGLKLSGWARFLEGKDKVFSIEEGLEVIMPKPLVYSLDFLLHITQDGSHGDGDLELKVDSYVRETKNINLFRSVLYIAMDLCLWFEKTVNKYSSIAIHKPKWGIRENAFICTGKVFLRECTDGKMRYVCDNYLIGEPEKYEKLTEGDTIGIIKDSGPNNFLFEYTNEDGIKTAVNMRAIPKDVVRL